jgi:hypothetical protein
LGSEGDVGLEPDPVVVAVFATPPHAQATSARRSGSICTPENFAEPLTEPWTERIARHTSTGFIPINIFEFARHNALLDKGVVSGQCPQRQEFQRKTL